MQAVSQPEELLVPRIRLRPPRGRAGHKSSGIVPGVPTVVRRYVTLYCACFALYAILGKGFAYVGVSPVYVGEVLLGLSVVVAVFYAGLQLLSSSPLGVLLIIFGIWQAVCTVPYLTTYKIDSLRDAVVWGYSVFAWCVAALVCRYPGIIDKVIERYKRFANWYVFLGPLSVLVTWYLAGSLPTVPGSDVPILHLKPGDMLVHLAGIIAYLLAGMALRKLWWLIPAFVGVVVGGVLTRGGFVAILCATLFAAILRGPSKQLVRLIVGAALGGTILLMLLIALDVHLKVPGRAREISADQIFANVDSIGGSESGGLDATKRWRLEWWKKIIDYTVHGPYFWTGKGYGINLSESDGFRVGLGPGSEPLRSPHNSHMTFLARSGVPGMLLWAAVQLTWLGLMIQSLIRSRRLRLSKWSGLFIWLAAYWLAFMVNSSFDVVLEGPMSGIPFWTVFGLGWGAHVVFSQRDGRVGPKRRRRYRSVTAVALPDERLEVLA